MGVNRDAKAWDRLVRAVRTAEPLPFEDDAWLVVADALEEAGERRLGRNVRILVTWFRRLIAFEAAGLRRSWRVERAARAAYGQMYVTQESVLDHLGRLVGAATVAHHIARGLGPRQRSVLAWIIEDWEWAYREGPVRDVMSLVEQGLLEPPTEDSWGDATPLGRKVWRYARARWIVEHRLEEAQISLKNR